MAKVATLITDFSTMDSYVGAIKGVLLDRSPDVNIIDITHDIPPYDVPQAAFVLKGAYSYYPKGAVHIVVVDPGVGSRRRSIAMKCGDHYFVGPDNGVFSFPIKEQGIETAVAIESQKCEFRYCGRTFDGRDIFAPIAAKLLDGVDITTLGEKIDDPMCIDLSEPKITDDTIVGKVFYIDRFGNCITNIEAKDLDKFEGEELMVNLAGHDVGLLRTFYSEVKMNEPIALINSSGNIEIAVNQGNASEELAARVGSIVKISLVK